MKNVICIAFDFGIITVTNRITIMQYTCRTDELNMNWTQFFFLDYLRQFALIQCYFHRFSERFSEFNIQQTHRTDFIWSYLIPFAFCVRYSVSEIYHFVCQLHICVVPALSLRLNIEYTVLMKGFNYFECNTKKCYWDCTNNTFTMNVKIAAFESPPPSTQNHSAF